MAGLTDVPFRTLAWRYGAGYMVSEMVSSKPQLWETGKSRLRRVPVPGVQPNAVQLAGTDPKVLAESARRHVDQGVEVIDINLGCPAKKVCKKLAGSALLANLPLLGELVESVTAAVGIPVTVKTRLGLQPGDGIGLEAARVAQEAGAQMVVMHARSRACRFAGQVDYAGVAAVKAALTIPVLVNGDIASVQRARYALKVTRADGIMLGRGALGRPWIFCELSGKELPSLVERWQVMAEHLDSMHDFYGEPAGVRIARKHIAAYAEVLDFSGYGIRLNTFQQINSAAGQLSWLCAARDQYLEHQEHKVAQMGREREMICERQTDRQIRGKGVGFRD